MSVDIHLIEKALYWRAAGHCIFWVTVVRAFGSSPRPVGAVMIVRDDGLLAGSVSGGCVEDDLVAALTGDTGEFDAPRLFRYGVSDERARRVGLACGGAMEVLVEPVRDELWLRALHGALTLRRGVERRVSLGDGAVTVREVPGALNDGVQLDDHAMTHGMGPPWRLLLIGAAQLSRDVAQFALALGYHVRVCDPRENYALSWDFPGVYFTRVMPDDAVRAWANDARCAVAVLTHDPRLDDLALMAALPGDAFFVGALGSRRTAEARRARLLGEGLSEAAVARLRGPVGLPLGGRDSAEIALAIVAELTACRHGRELGVVEPVAAPLAVTEYA